MKDAFEASKDDFDSWVDKWDKAQKSDIFKAPQNLPSTAPQTSQNSFFGMQQFNPTDDIKSTDAEYWNAIYSTSDGVDAPMERIDEADATSLNLPNPIRKSTEGKDQNLTGDAIGSTFSEEDIENLAEMKVKLHELESKIATMENNERYQSQVKDLIKKIDDLSDKMCGKK
jgi:hypothetical protein